MTTKQSWLCYGEDMDWKLVDDLFKQRVWYSAGVVAAIIIAGYVFIQSATYLLVIVAGLILATVMHSLIVFLCQKTNFPYLLMYSVTWLLVVGLPIGLLYVSAPELGSQFTELKESVQQLGQPGTDLPAWIPARSYVESQVSAFDPALFFGESIIVGQLSSLAFTVGGILTGVAALLFVGLYVSLNPKLYTRTILSFVPKKKHAGIEKKLTRLATALSSWMTARLFSMAVVAALTYTGLLILGVPQALFLSLLAGLLSFVPNIGPILAVIPAALVAVIQSPLLLLYVIILYSLVQIIESYFITPFVQQRVVATPPAILISTQVIFGVLFGIMGLVLAAPVLASIFALRDASTKSV